MRTVCVDALLCGEVTSLKYACCRSPAVVIAYLMRYKGWRLPQCYQWVKDRRPSINLSEGVLVNLFTFSLGIIFMYSMFEYLSTIYLVYGWQDIIKKYGLVINLHSNTPYQAFFVWLFVCDLHDTKYGLVNSGVWVAHLSRDSSRLRDMRYLILTKFLHLYFPCSWTLI